MIVLNWRLEKGLPFRDPYNGSCRGGQGVGVGGGYDNP